MKVIVTRGSPRVWNLFDNNTALPGPDFEYQHCSGKFVGDCIGDAEIKRWSENPDRRAASKLACDFDDYIWSKYNLSVSSYGYCEKISRMTYRFPVIISAQTGKGKNYFVTNTLREFARKCEKEILYISNRVALGYQQKKDLANAIGSPLKDWENREIFENVRVLTYQKLLDCCNSEEAQKLKNYDYVVLDECHFFYSDAFFNPQTWEILNKTVELFQNAVRIYMSATLEDVIDPIRYIEGKVLEANQDVEYGTSSVGEYALAYDFPRNYSNYKVSFFSDWKQLFPKMVSTKEKWLVFVTSKGTGKKMIADIDEYTKGSDLVTYIDSDTRNSEKNEDRILWDSLLRTGKYESKILITTSVLDNGFSIKDTDVKHIVLFTHDRTEFLQELGRFRLSDDKTQVNLYIKKYTPTTHAKRKTMYNRYCEMLKSIDGDGTKYKQGDIRKAVKALWRDSNGQQLRNCFYFKEREGLLEPVLNEMARWRIKRLGQQIDDYEKLLEQAGEDASAIYKARWLEKELSECNDFDFDKHQDAINKMRTLLDSQSSEQLVEGTKQHIDFSSQFIELFKIIDPSNTAISRSKRRYKHGLGHDALKNRLNDLRKYNLFYELQFDNDTKEIKISHMPQTTE